jgi:hypothetical protein
VFKGYRFGDDENILVIMAAQKRMGTSFYGTVHLCTFNHKKIKRERSRGAGAQAGSAEQLSSMSTGAQVLSIFQLTIPGV